MRSPFLRGSQVSRSNIINIAVIHASYYIIPMYVIFSLICICYPCIFFYESSWNCKCHLLNCISLYCMTVSVDRKVVRPEVISRSRISDMPQQHYIVHATRGKCRFSIKRYQISYLGLYETGVGFRTRFLRSFHPVYLSLYIYSRLITPDARYKLSPNCIRDSAVARRGGREGESEKDRTRA